MARRRNLRCCNPADGNPRDVVGVVFDKPDLAVQSHRDPERKFTQCRKMNGTPVPGNAGISRMAALASPRMRNHQRGPTGVVKIGSSPFQIIASEGLRYDIRHPDLVLVGRRDLTIGFPDRKLPTIYSGVIRVAMVHVVGIEDLQDASKNGPQASNGPASS